MHSLQKVKISQRVVRYFKVARRYGSSCSTKEIYGLSFSELLKKTVILEDLDGVYTAISYYFLRKYNTSL